MDVHYAAGAFGGDDHEPVMLALAFARAFRLQVGSLVLNHRAVVFLHCVYRAAKLFAGILVDVHD
ncbi:hypothetical protein PUN49_23375 [Pseudomonas extremaustralis]|uniref:hypothetical protein n=1 Tax=Pseudomonas extremaustralis TaxID=359110 RepID=UPI0021C7B61F|nr:hypothetical protein [Pseudomonas extremaustralis]MDB1113296.1 hypothetical protein [Pseudomonas extremaustralis]MDG2969966.1 hypothetical protein [Pseudomonas extremaustralis]UUJ43626.1 hypothetical protein L1A22_20940 [Pseudomonas extremaustralis]